MDYKAIINGLQTESVIELMKKLGADRYEEKEDFVIFPTICHNPVGEDASMKLYFYKDKKLFVCYTCCGTMSIFKMLKTYYETNQIEYDWYDDVYSVVLDCSKFNKREGFAPAAYRSMRDTFELTKPAPLPIFSSGALDCFTKMYPEEWLRDGISKEAMDKFNIRYSISQNKIIIPHVNVDGELVGIRGRALNDWEIENLGKYMPVRIEQTWYKHKLSLNLYGLHENQDHIRKRKICYVFESEKSVLQCESFTDENCAVAVCGSNFNKFQLQLLIKTCAPDEIVLCFDQEELPGEDKYFNKLYSICNKYKAYCNFSFIYDRLGLLDLKDSPSDRGVEVFNKLLSRRTRVK